MKKKIIFRITLVALAVLVIVLLIIIITRGQKTGQTADIWVDGELYKTVSLSVDTEFVVETDYGYNRVSVSNGEIAVVEADCDEQVCVNQGYVSSPLIPITCLPHRIVIQVVE